MRDQQAILKSLTEHWTKQGVTPAEGVTLTDIQKFERENAVTIPQDLRDYLLIANGMLNEKDDFFRFLGLQELKAADDASLHMAFGEAFREAFPDGSDFFVFVDYLHWSWGYAIHLTKGNDANNLVVPVGKLSCPVIASCFSEFVDLYVHDDPRVYLG